MSKKLFAVIGVALLVLLYLRFDYFYKNQKAYQDGERAKLLGVVSEEPKFSFGKQRVKINTTGGTKITAVTSAVPMYEYGDDLQIDGVFTKEEFKGHNFWVMYFPGIKIRENDHNSITTMAESIRNEAKKLFENTLPPIHASLLLGIVLGGKQNMPDAFLENLRTVGVLHVIAASGMNVSFVAIFLMATLGKVLRRSLALFTAILGVGFYVMLAGFEPSVVRAAIMCTLAFSASLLGRQGYALGALIITGYLMLLFEPGLIEDIGFQLSFLATLGILLVKPLLDSWLAVWKDKIRFINTLNDDITTTLSAQIVTLPILLGVFGSYGLLSVLANALTLWTIPILMTLGSLAILLGIVFAPLGKLFLFLSYPLLWFFETVVNFLGQVGWVLEIPAMPMVVWFGYYLILGAIVWSNKKQIQNRKEPLIVREV